MTIGDTYFEITHNLIVDEVILLWLPVVDG
jgi:hypothetical protein